MNIIDKKLFSLETKIEEVRRRKLADYKQKDFSYIDTDNNLDKLKIYNNNIIEARRGCGKTSIILKALEETKELSVQCDCQIYRNKEKDIVVLDILRELVVGVKESIQTEETLEFVSEYENKTKGFLGFLRKKFKRISPEEIRKYENIDCFLEWVNEIESIIKKTKELPAEYKWQLTRKNSASKKIVEKNSEKRKNENSISGTGRVALKYKDLSTQINCTTSLLDEMLSEYLNEKNSVNEMFQQEEHVQSITRVGKVDELKGIIIDFLKAYKEQYKRGIIIYLDDFYQINKESHPYIIQYLHDLYKLTPSNTFCFKVVTLPSSLKINYDNEVTFSIKDDFSSIYLDYDLSNLDKVQDHLIDILIALEPKLQLRKNDIESLFTNDDALKFLVIATGGIPRDFMTSFCEAIRVSRRLQRDRIGKDQIYEVIKNLKSDKDNNIEIDSELSMDKIENAIEIINREIIGSMKTNVILYPIDKAEQHEVILKNLINLRYLHLIKSKMTSEKTKQECRAYLVDMTFYACSRIPSSFDFCRFWEKDNASRLNNLRRAPIWSFSDECVEKIMN